MGYYDDEKVSRTVLAYVAIGLIVAAFCLILTNFGTYKRWGETAETESATEIITTEAIITPLSENRQAVTEIALEEPETDSEAITVHTLSIETETEAEPETETEAEEYIEFVVTAYCPCEKCCGKWANNRPTDDSGDPIVYTASGERAVQGVTIAADTSILPFGTKVSINENVYTVHDRGGAIKGNRIDIYFETHEEAGSFGRQILPVEIIEIGGQTK